MADAARILVVDDEPNIRRLLEAVLSDEGYRTESFGDAESLRARLKRGSADLVLLDVLLPGMSGVDWLATHDHSPPVVMMSGHANIELALHAVKLGAVDFLEKPITAERLLLSVANALERSRLAAENARLRARTREELLGEAPPMVELREAIARVAPTDAPVLVTGESGSGKELVARAIHRQSARRGGELVQVNCAAIPTELLESELFGHEKGAFSGADRRRRGRFEIADRGTLVLDEIGEMPTALQAKLLRVLEEDRITPLGAERPVPVDVRLVCSTNVDLEAAVRDGRFREDLFHRICVLRLRVPPLREHPDDIPVYATRFLEEFASRLGRDWLEFDDSALGFLRRQAFPGNVRELRNLAQRVAVLATGPTVTEQAVRELLGEGNPPSEGRAAGGTLADALEALERRLIREAVDASGGNLAEAGRRLGVDRANLHRRMKRLGIER